MRIKQVGLVLGVVVIACAAYTAEASAALPEFSPAAPNPFVSTSGKTTLETVSKNRVTCTADTASGQITGPNSLTVVFRFTGCVDKKIPCMSPNGKPGEIVTTTLSGKLGYVVNPEIKKVGVDLSSPTGAPIAEFFCGAALRGVVTGSVIGQITPVNKLIAPPKQFTLKFTQKKGMQAITNLFAEPTDILMTSFGGPAEVSGLSSTDKITFSAPVAIKA